MVATHEAETRSAEPKTARTPTRSGSLSRSGTLSRDRFDELKGSSRVGAHRIVGKPKRFWIYLVTAVLGIALLTGAGIVLLQVTGANVEQFTGADEPIEPVEPTVAPELNPEATVAVINGTSMLGFGAIVDDIITENSWGTIAFSTEGETNDVAISAIFYSSPELEAAALGLAQELGGISVYENSEYAQAFDVQLTVLLGADYGGPGADQLVLAEPAAGADPGADAGADPGADAGADPGADESVGDVS